jgi:hypothetical protein
MITFTSNCCAAVGLKMQKKMGGMYAVRFEVLTVSVSSGMLRLTVSKVK